MHWDRTSIPSKNIRFHHLSGYRSPDPQIPKSVENQFRDGLEFIGQPNQSHPELRYKSMGVVPSKFDPVSQTPYFEVLFLVVMGYIYISSWFAGVKDVTGSLHISKVKACQIATKDKEYV